MIASHVQQPQSGRASSGSAPSREEHVIGRANLIGFVVGALLIAAGFYTLAKGSLTLAPICLVAGYCVAIPAAIMMGGRRRGRDSDAEGTRANSSAG